MHYELFQPTLHWDWVKQNIGCVLCEDTQGLIIRDTQEGEIKGALLSDNWTPNACQAHIYVNNPILLRKALPLFFGHIFKEAGRNIVYGITPANNEKALKLAKHIGFEQLAVLKDGYSEGVDFVLSRITSDKCRWVTHVV